MTKYCANPANEKGANMANVIMSIRTLDYIPKDFLINENGCINFLLST